ncbi:YbhB/YbcL family Raf kinase inhibitor-like protein [Kosakonia radicincitans]|uniref:YbhB/YbcL family Raf kinase inhibitor-like protein n=1 Tax=Kosakonia radicincitans TaxID=283686 RepID=UPI0009E22484
MDKKSQRLSEPYGFGCSGSNSSPSFRWSGAPADTKSFVLQIYDRDAPTGPGWVHWQVVNIPASANSVPANIAPDKDGVEWRSHRISNAPEMFSSRWQTLPW